jgi:hypothetical protein
MIKNRNHVQGVRDAVHAGISEFGTKYHIGEGGLDGADAVTGIAMVLRDMIKSAPDSYTRSMLARQVINVIEDAARGPLILPGGHA